MASTESNSSYYIRIRGKVLGPYTIKQLNTLRTRGQFGQSNEVSIDGQSWQSAATLEAIFPVVIKDLKSSAEISNCNLPGTPSSEKDHRTDWYYSVNEEQQGPVSLKELQELLTLGRVNLNDLMWTEGMPEWRPASEIQELNTPVPKIEKPRTAEAKVSQTISRYPDLVFQAKFLMFLARVQLVLGIIGTLIMSIVFVASGPSAELMHVLPPFWREAALMLLFSLIELALALPTIVFYIVISMAVGLINVAIDIESNTRSCSH